MWLISALYEINTSHLLYRCGQNQEQLWDILTEELHNPIADWPHLLL